MNCEYAQTERAGEMQEQDGRQTQAGPRVQSIDRAVAILRCFDSRRPEIGISELSRRTGLSTSTVHRLLSSMAENDLVRRSAERRYSLGPLIIQLGRNGGFPTTLRDAALPFARELRDEVDETVGIHELLPSGRRRVVDQVESHQELRRTYTEFGVPIPLPHGAPGKVLLAHLLLERQEWWLSRPIDAATSRTIADPAALRTQLAAIRDRGWASSDGERTPGIRAVAAPIFDHTGAVAGALGLSVPTIRMDAARSEQLGRRVVDVAWRISQILGATREGVQQTLTLAGGPP